MMKSRCSDVQVQNLIAMAKNSRAWIEQIARILSGNEGRFILTLNDVQGVRETFAAFNLSEVRTTYSIAAKGAQNERPELPISNWKLP